jgi:phosphoglycolate phosphatase
MTAPNMGLSTILFDLDGTLLDTAPDLAHAVNSVRRERDLAPLSLQAVRPHVSHGSYALTRVGFGVEESSADFEPLRQRLLEIYHQNIALHTRLFDGMEGLLADLEQWQIRWGVVTNKPGWLTEPLLASLGLDHRPACVISGDSTSKRKPHPDPLLRAAERIGVAPEQCMYVGDAERDIKAGRSAGMFTVVALYGYIAPGESPETWGADGSVAEPGELTRWLARCEAR